MALILIMLLPQDAFSDELEMINHPVNSSGLTGLLYTAAPYTLPYRTMEIGIATISEKSFEPDFTASSYPVTIGYGISRDHEIAVRAQYWNIRSANAAAARGIGDTQLSWKWNFLQQPERSPKPWFSVLGTAIFPSGDQDAGVSNVQHWGARLGIVAGSEIEYEDYILGLYADAQFGVQDLSDPVYRDRYQLFNAGVLFPISKFRNLQMLIEYNRMGGKDTEILHDVTYSAVTYGLRLVSTMFNLTFGTQFVHRLPEGYENSSRVIGMVSVKF